MALGFGTAGVWATSGYLVLLSQDFVRLYSSRYTLRRIPSKFRLDILSTYSFPKPEDAMTDKRISGAQEDNVTSNIESQTSQVPSSAFLALAGGSIVGAAALKLAGKDDWALFVGQWAAPFMLLGIYNKLVKQLGSDAESRNSANGTPSPT
jgi:hypothetical protein